MKPSPPPAERRELLVVLTAGTTSDTLERLRQVSHVVQVGSTRVLVVRASPTDAVLLMSIPGVAMVSSGTIDERMLGDLDEREVLFARAWESRRLGEGKQRPQEGLEWDTSGSEPPDDPSTT